MAIQPRRTRIAMGQVAYVLAAVSCIAACGGWATSVASQATGAGEATVWTAMNRGGPVNGLQCRGGPGYEFKSLGYKAYPTGATRVAVAMTFAASPDVAGSDNQNLQPGTCALTARPLAASDPREVHFLTDAFTQLLPGPIDISVTAAEVRPDVRSMVDYLRDPSHYWSFHVLGPHGGYYDAVIHEHWRDRSGPSPVPAAVPAPSVVRWLLRVVVSGGIAGSRREVSVNGEGRVQANGSGTFGNIQCTATISRNDVQAIEAALARAHAEAWPTAYPMKGNGCCDQLQYTLHLDQDDQVRRISHETSWMSENTGAVPEPVSALYKLIYEARHACAF